MITPVELGSFSEVPDLTVLTALERAERHEIGSAPSRQDVAEHLGFLWTPGTGRKLSPILLALEAEGYLALGADAGGPQRCHLTRRGQNRLQNARRAEVAEALFDSLPESPQHRTWRWAREAAIVGAGDFLASTTTAVQQAESVLVKPTLATSVELMAIGHRLRLQFWRLASVTYCIHEWAEPNEKRANVEKKMRLGFWPFPRRHFQRWPDEMLFAEGAVV